MIKYLLPLTVLCFCSFFAVGQNLEVVNFHPNPSGARMDCSLFTWDAGTSSQALDATAQSNDVEFLCMNDALIITHDGNFNLDPASDPEPLTDPGIAYIVYDCPPTISGPTIMDIEMDGCLTPPGGADALLFDGGTDALGDGVYTNNGAIQTALNAGNPVEIYFAPITVENYAGNSWSEGQAACVSLTASDAFRVVYLNEIIASNQNNNTGNCSGSFDIEGGLSQFDILNGGTSSYTITIEENGNPTNTGTVTSGPATHNSTVTFTVPTAGLYDIIIEDGKSCGASLSINMPAASCVSSVTSTYTPTNVSCNGAMDGSILIDINTGTPPFDFQWQLQPGGALQTGTLATGNQFDITGLAPGTYDITITDDNGLMETGTQAITEPNALGASIVIVSQPSCNGEATGSLMAEVTSGGVVIVPDATYTFDWGLAQTTQTITNVPSGPYSIVVTDGNGCTATASLTLSQPAAITAPPITGADVTNASCTGVADGSVTVTASGGTGTLVYNWSTTPAQTTATATNLEPGTYTVTVSDDNACSQTYEGTIGANTILTATAVATDITCNGANDGEVTATPIVAPGTIDNGGYTFSWTPNVGAGTTINSLGMDTYEVTVTDANGCTATATDDVAEPAALSITTVPTPESCSTGNDGEVAATVSGGTQIGGTYNFLWSNAETTATITGLVGNTYSVTVTDANSCSATASDVVNSPTGPSITSINVTDIQCVSNMDGELVVNAVQGNDPITTYAWSNAATTATNSNLAPGVYTVTVTDAGGCQTTGTETVSAPPALIEASAAVTTTPTCPNGGEGTITVDVQGGVPISSTVDYSYDWSNGSTTTTSTLSNLVAGTYDVTVTDGNNCPLVIAGIVVNDPPAINVIFQNVQPVSCFGGIPCDGEATIVASGGLSTSYTFTWESGESSTGGSSTAVQLCQGNQNVTVTDGFCTVVFDMGADSIPAPPVVGIADLQTTAVTCFGDTDGSATITPTGGTGGPYNIVWSNGDVGDTASNLAPNTNYIVNITDAQGCVSVPFTITVGEPQPLDLLVVDTVNISCNGEDDGIIQVAPVGGNIGTFTYEWSPNTTNDLNIATSLAAGTYNVTVTDSNGCTATNTADVNEPTPIQFTYTPPVEPICFGEIAQTPFSIDTVFGGSGTPYTYTIDEFNFQSTNQAAAVAAGVYTITVFDSLMRCSVSEEMTIGQPAEILVDLGPDVEIQLGEEYEIIPTITPLGAMDSFFWSPAIGLDCTDCFNPTASPSEDQTYTLFVFDDNGCPGSDNIFVDIDPNRNVFIPNVFSPNGDGANDYFSPFVGVGVENIQSILIFDRWGEVVYSAQNFVPDGIGNNGWDGRIGSSKILNPAVFIYVIEVSFVDGEVLTYKGDVTLVK